MKLDSGPFTTLEGLEEPREVNVSDWLPLDLSPAILSAISSLNFSKPTDIQKAAIPLIIAGHDVIGKASTGSGKTLAFGIPIVERWLELHTGAKNSDTMEDDCNQSEQNVPIALILSPTRELAHQLTNHLKALCKILSPSPYICSVTGGLSIFKQQRLLRTAHIVIGTPGRLWEVISSSNVLLNSFKKIKFLVIDEADRLLSEGHFKEASEILKALDRSITKYVDPNFETPPASSKESEKTQIKEYTEIEDKSDEDAQSLPPRQTLVFSATFNKSLQQKLSGPGRGLRYDLTSSSEQMEYLLSRLNFRSQPKFLDMNPVRQMAEGLEEGLVECGAMDKDLYLYTLLLYHPNSRALVFTNSISCVRRLAPMLQNLNLYSLPLHSQMPQKARLRSIERFVASTPSKPGILIATDVAARGLDIKDIDLVIHYHVPRTADVYVHRSGRTARAERTGRSILICSPEEVVPTRRLVAKVHASSSSSQDKKFFIRTLSPEKRIISAVKARVLLAKKLADSTLAKEKGTKEENWLKNAAEDLGVEYDSEEFEKANRWGGRGSGRKKRQEEARGITRDEAKRLRANLRDILGKRINVGVSERYIGGGGLRGAELNKLIKGDDGGLWLGQVEGLGFD